MTGLCSCIVGGDRKLAGAPSTEGACVMGAPVAFQPQVKPENQPVAAGGLGDEDLRRESCCEGVEGGLGSSCWNAKGLKSRGESGGTEDGAQDVVLAGGLGERRGRGVLGGSLRPCARRSWEVKASSARGNGGQSRH